jgi:hypothetical protein
MLKFSFPLSLSLWWYYTIIGTFVQPESAFLDAISCENRKAALPDFLGNAASD